MTEEPPHKRTKLDASDKKKEKFLPTYGNYRGYYSKRTAASGLDQRLSLVSEDWVKGKRVLDIGCNTGFITIQLAQTYAPYRVTGVDIDEHLISRAEKQVEFAFSRQGPISDDSTTPPAPNYFPMSLARSFGFLPQPPCSWLHRFHELSPEEAAKATQRKNGKQSRGQAMPRQVRLFPSNIRFVHADWLIEDVGDDYKGYDLVLALSVLKWIHINDGDQGLKDFFAKAFKTLRPSGKFVFEPQPWSSYKKCKRMSPKLKANYEGLRLRPEQFGNIMCEEIGFERVEQLGEPGHGGFQRGVFVAYKPKGAWV